MNYLRPNLKHGEITQEEEAIIIDLHKQWGSKWSKIAKSLPGRTDNEIKNYWRSHLKRKLEARKTGTISHTKQDIVIPTCDTSRDYIDIESNMSGNEGIFGISSSETPEMSNMNALGNDSPYEIRISEWISSCCSWPRNDHVKHDEDCMGMYTYPCFCQRESSSEESKNHGVWDLWNPIWEMQPPSPPLQHQDLLLPMVAVMNKVTPAGVSMQRFEPVTGNLTTEYVTDVGGDFGEPASCVVVLPEEEDPVAGED
ncbi:hypothetical protein E3N88_16203 [Mikania micrantha]|uniref:Uncharacterized protein n=1 Tax=Mikania micrantha TaxID=192012 RepID=A0A5N6NZV9_9ASTR|nr:hypothetical protein E3N88_16203 [Mikania micrantha]